MSSQPQISILGTHEQKPQEEGNGNGEGEVGLQWQSCTRRSPSGWTEHVCAAELADRFLKEGNQGLTDCEVLELLFSLVLPNDECWKDARKCTMHFPSLRGVMEAPSEELLQGGLSPAIALCIRLAVEIATRVLRQKVERGSCYESSQEVCDYLNYSMRSLSNEVFRVIYLDGRNRIIETLDLAEGTPNYVAVFPRQILDHAIRYRATHMILAHNHPTGDALPSRNDKQITRDMVFLGNALQIKVLDHIIVADNSHFSFSDEGLIEKYEDTFLTLRRKAVA